MKDVEERLDLQDPPYDALVGNTKRTRLGFSGGALCLKY